MRSWWTSRSSGRRKTRITAARRHRRPRRDSCCRATGPLRHPPRVSRMMKSSMPSFLKRDGGGDIAKATSDNHGRVSLQPGWRCCRTSLIAWMFMPYVSSLKSALFIRHHAQACAEQPATVDWGSSRWVWRGRTPSAMMALHTMRGGPVPTCRHLIPMPRPFLTRRSRRVHRRLRH